MYLCMLKYEQIFMITLFSIPKYLNRFQLAARFDEPRFLHWFLPREGINNCYVIETDGVITGEIFHNLLFVFMF